MICFFVIPIFQLYLMFIGFFFVFPDYLHKTHSKPFIDKLIPNEKITIFPHRGGALEAPENSINAYNRAIRLGLKVLDMDLRITKDGVYILHHDQSLINTTGQDIDVKDINYDDIRPFKPIINYGDGTFYRLKPDERNDKPALLSETLDLIKDKDVLLNIENKTSTNDTIFEILNKAQRKDVLEKMIIGQFPLFNSKDIENRYGSTVNTFFPVDPAKKCIYAYLLGVLPFMPLYFDFYETYFPLQLNFSSYSYYFDLKALLIDLLWLNIKLMNWHLKRRGIKIVYFIVDDEMSLDSSIFLGAQAILTNRPERVKEWLIQRNKY